MIDSEPDLSLETPPRVLAVLVSFNPNVKPLSLALEAIAEQVDHTVVVDNASANRAEIEAAIDDRPAISLLKQSTNGGLGRAHNIGIDYARQHGFSHVLLLDQDSVPLTGMVDRLLLALKAKQHLQILVSAVGATYINADNGSESFFVGFGWLKFVRRYCKDRDSSGCVPADFLISSGSLIPLSTLEDVGDMDESLFIDHVDTEWYLRAKSKGYQCFGVCDAVMQHGLGEQTHRISLGRQRNVPQHKPFRYYYIFRNSLTLYRRSYASRVWKWNDGQRLILIALMFGLWKSPRRENLQMIWAGIRDGFRGVTGPMH